MSEGNTATARTFKSVNGKALGEAAQGNISFASASKLYKEGKVDVIMAEGVLEATKMVEGNYGVKPQYSIRSENGDLILVDGFGSLDSQMKKVNPGTYVQITYLGKDEVKTGPRKGTLAHRALVGIAE